MCVCACLCWGATMKIETVSINVKLMDSPPSYLSLTQVVNAGARGKRAHPSPPATANTVAVPDCRLPPHQTPPPPLVLGFPSSSLSSSLSSSPPPPLSPPLIALPSFPCRRVFVEFNPAASSHAASSSHDAAGVSSGATAADTAEATA
jgi:hypothetical protein